MQNNNSDSEEDEIIAAAAAVIILAAQVPVRSCWVREWVGRRETHGAYATIVQELMNEDPQAYKQFVRMRYEHFRELEVLVDPLIRRQDTVMRQSIKPGERLAVTLRYLGSGSTFADLSPIFRIPARSIRDIVLDTCDALYTALADDYLKNKTVLVICQTAHLN
ncbi:hypothetical protein BaRGS_00037768 [Batillaria attramentaria]|uniref:Uncharacterized protein n=1 Tax=Batillaria attramentaria TaxID=370345 RepID=A0ABD0J888_9CAEN